MGIISGRAYKRQLMLFPQITKLNSQIALLLCEHTITILSFFVSFSYHLDPSGTFFQYDAKAIGEVKLNNCFIIIRIM